jgi:hypothetical protein
MDILNNLRDAAPTSASGKNVKDTKQLSGEAKDSLSGKNKTEQYYEAGLPSAAKSKMGAEDTGS